MDSIFDDSLSENEEDEEGVKNILAKYKNLNQIEFNEKV